ncbi:hypothetical protein B0T26DRAFT_750038 [Lasiosphaeria miniovina]|uniref:Uncharacterized protein n=1 Tax=Lasiosphaeria miniovina TaxID=1954250 RepID=A0AA40AVE1_9PEZI|nr:uncharacterized protein B0T26DRAFT_750038 [Lasiosphaeria miniovina]KAK0722666.1 hypothetical protein B0T26DRAFT_750038 [Lasiosphaeria miniovina]
MAGNLPQYPSNRMPAAQNFPENSFVTYQHVPFSCNANPEYTMANQYAQPGYATTPTEPAQVSYDNSGGQSSSGSGGEEVDNEPITTHDGKLRCNWLNKKKGTRCDTICDRPGELTKHRKNHTPRVKCEVPDCRAQSNTFAEEKERYRHYAQHHAGTVWADHPRARAFMMVCDVCGYRGRKDNVKRHREKKH